MRVCVYSICIHIDYMYIKYICVYAYIIHMVSHEILEQSRLVFAMIPVKYEIMPNII